MTGTVNISRGIWDDTAFKDQPLTEREAFMWMIMEASWKPREKRIGNCVVWLERGQLAASIRFMAEAWKWQKSTVDRFLKRLKNRDMIGTADGTAINVITICNYDTYQSVPKSSGTAKTPKPGQQRDSTGTNENKDEIREQDTEEEPNGSLSSGDDDPPPPDEVSQALDAYNAAATEVGWPKVQKLTKARATALRARLNEVGGFEGWAHALEKARASPHLCGQNDRSWVANFDFLTRQSSFTKLMEGNYDPKPHNVSQFPSHSGEDRPKHRTDPALARIARLQGLGKA